MWGLYRLVGFDTVYSIVATCLESYLWACRSRTYRNYRPISANIKYVKVQGMERSALCFVIVLRLTIQYSMYFLYEASV